MSHTHDTNGQDPRKNEEGCCGSGGCCCGETKETAGAGGASASTSPGASACCGEGKETAGAQVGDCSCGDCGGEPCMPAPTFSTFVLSLASSALVNLGEVPDPSTGKQEANLVLAKHTIDLINKLQEKIHNGLDAEESRLLEGVLYELRMKFVLKK